MKVNAEKLEDPIAKIGQIIGETINQVQEKFQGVSSTVESSIPDIVTVANKTLYSTCYYLAFGTVYAAVSTANFFMGDNPAGQGFREGASAAKSAASVATVKKAVRKRPVAKAVAKTAPARPRIVKKAPKVEEEKPSE